MRAILALLTFLTTKLAFQAWLPYKLKKERVRAVEDEPCVLQCFTKLKICGIIYLPKFTYFFENLQTPPCLLLLLFCHVVIIYLNIPVSVDVDHQFHEADILPPRTGVKGQRSLSQLSRDASLIIVRNPERTNELGAWIPCNPQPRGVCDCHVKTITFFVTKKHNFNAFSLIKALDFFGFFLLFHWTCLIRQWKGHGGCRALARHYLSTGTHLAAAMCCWRTCIKAQVQKMCGWRLEAHMDLMFLHSFISPIGAFH